MNNVLLYLLGAVIISRCFGIYNISYYEKKTSDTCRTQEKGTEGEAAKKIKTQGLYPTLLKEMNRIRRFDVSYLFSFFGLFKFFVDPHLVLLHCNNPMSHFHAPPKDPENHFRVPPKNLENYLVIFQFLGCFFFFIIKL